MKYRLNEKINHHEKRASNPKLSETQREYSRSFVSSAVAVKTMCQRDDLSLDHLKWLQQADIDSRPKNAMASGGKQGRLAAFNSFISQHPERRVPPPTYGNRNNPK